MLNSTNETSSPAATEVVSGRISNEDLATWLRRMAWQGGLVEIGVRESALLLAAANRLEKSN